MSRVAGKRRLWPSGVVALLLGVAAAWTVMAVVISATSGKRHADIYWPTIVLLLLFAVWAGRHAIRLARKVVIARRGRRISN
jgi:hypothetical protein